MIEVSYSSLVIKREMDVMKEKQEVTKRHSLISYLSLAIGIGCFFIVFVPFTRIANNGSLVGDFLAFFLSIAGILLSIAALLNKKEKKIIPRSQKKVLQFAY